MYYFIYKPKPTEIKFDTDDNYYYDYDYKNNNSQLHNKMQKPEVFYDITIDEATKNVNDLYKLQTYLQTYNDNYLSQINPIVNDTKIEISNQGKNISKLITERYILQFLDSINKANAVAYGEFFKYKKNEKINILPNKSSHMKK
jgi:hypothetical protein